MKSTEMRCADLLYEMVLRTALDGFWLVDGRGRFLDVNDAYCALMGYSREELLDMRICDVEVGMTPEQIIACLEHIRATKGERFETQHRRKDGQVIDLELSVSYLKEHDGIFFVFARDLTGHKRRGQMLPEHDQEAVLRLSRLSTVGIMAGEVAHEINGPLNIISMAAEQLPPLLNGNGTCREHAERLCTSILRNTGRISQITHSLNSLMRNDGADATTFVSLREIVGDTLELCQTRLTEHDITLSSADIPPGLEIECWPTQISQVLLNLLSNACDAVDSLDERWIRVDVQDEGDKILLSVTDSGKGIPCDLRTRLFTPFFTTKCRGNGVGLGLNISARIARNHGGNLFLDEYAPNTRFVLRLPK